MTNMYLLESKMRSIYFYIHATLIPGSRWSNVFKIGLNIVHIVRASRIVECVSSLWNSPWGVSKMIESDGVNF